MKKKKPQKILDEYEIDEDSDIVVHRDFRRKKIKTLE
jgi:hypothetical protein